LGKFPQTIYEINKKRKKKHKQKLKIMTEQESTKIEFLLTLNDNIVVQRFFNVRGYNPKAKNSLEFYYFMKSFKEELQYLLKMKTVTYMMDNQDSISNDPTIMNTSFTDGPEIFNMYIKIGEQTICHRILDGKLFPPKVRYTVDIRPILKDALRDLTDIFSTKKLSFNYLGIDLSK
jgi:hypothetical protein